jgi:transposase
MCRQAEAPILSAEEKVELTNIARSRKGATDLNLRATIVLISAEGKPDLEIAELLRTTPNTVRKWRKRFNQKRMAGLEDLYRKGRPRKYNRKQLVKKIFAILEKKPPKGQAFWDGKAIAAELGIPASVVWMILREKGIKLNKQKSWCVSKDPLYFVKLMMILQLYIACPENCLVISIDEKTSIQALKLGNGYVKTTSGKIYIGRGSTYERNGTINLFAGLEVKTGIVHYMLCDRKRRIEFLEFLDKLMSELPEGKEIHIILDNYCIHKNCDEWLKNHPNVTFHFTPTSASWSNLVEVFFGVLTRKSLRGASFSNVDELKKAIVDHIEVHNENPKPYHWRQREIRGSQLKNTVSNFFD